jgi:hypothetical protein
MYVTSASTVDHSTLLPYRTPVGFEKFTGKMSGLLLHSNKRFVEVTKMQ